MGPEIVGVVVAALAVRSWRVLLIGTLAIIAWRWRTLRHFVSGVGTAIAFGSDPRALFDRARREGRSVLPFLPMMGRRAHFVCDPIAIAELHALRASHAGVYEAQHLSEFNIFGMSRQWLSAYGTFKDVTKEVHSGLRHKPIEDISQSFADALQGELAKLARRVEAAPDGVLRATYEDTFARAFFNASHLAAFGPDLPAADIEARGRARIRCADIEQDDFLRFDQAFPALAGLGNIPLPRELAVRLFAASGNTAITALKKTLGRWISSGRYKSAPAVAQGPIEAMVKGGLPLDDQAAGMIGLLLAVHSNSIRAIAWLLLYTLQSPGVLAALRDEVTQLRASNDPVTAAGLPARVPLLSSAFYEMLRLHSSVLGVRTAEQPISLPTQSGERFEVPKGDVLVIANMASHYDAEHFPDPTSFQARRFVRSDGSFTTPRHILPFGGGAGMCKGRVFAIFNELWTVILALEMFDLEFVSLELTPGRKMVDGAGATLTVPGEVPGRAGAAVGMPDDGFVLNLRLRR